MMNILNRAYYSITNVNVTQLTQSLLPTLSPTQKKVIAIASIALGIIAGLYIAFRCCLNSPGGGGRPPAQPIFTPPAQPYQPPYQQPYQPQPQPYVPPYNPIRGIPGQQGGQDPLVNDTALQDLLDIEQNIAKIRAELLEEQQVLDLVHTQRADFLLDEAFEDWEEVDAQKNPAPLDAKGQNPQIIDQKDQKDAKKDDQPQAKQDDPKDPPVIDVKDQTPPLVPDQLIPVQKDAKDDQPQAKQDDPKDPQPVDGKPLVVDVKPIVDVKLPTPQAPDQKDQKIKDANPNAAPKNDGLSKTEARIIELHNELEKELLRYPDVLRAYLENRFNNYGRKDSQEIFEHVSKLDGYMDHFPDQLQFIRKGLEEIESFLTNSLFTSQTESCLQEEAKVDLIVFHEFFNIVDKHYAVIEQHDPDLALRLKIKLANLPLIEGTDYKKRKDYKNIHLDEAEQRLVLIDHFQQREDEAIDQAIAQLKSKSMSRKEAKRLSRALETGNNTLSQQNVQKLRDALKSQMGSKAPKAWDSANDIFHAMNKHFTISTYANSGYGYGGYNAYYNQPYGQNPASMGLTSLYRASQAKNYFETHQEIPRWYHATNYSNFDPIIKSGEILVLQRQAYRGAWVSTQREPTMGDCVLVFKHSIAKIDPDVFIGYEKGKVRWRGLQKPIPVIPNLVLVGLAPTYNKTQKLAIVTLLQSKGIAKPKIVSTDVIDYIQREVMLKIGNPNLTEKWWGKADVTHLENPLAQLQHNI